MVVVNHTFSTRRWIIWTVMFFTNIDTEIIAAVYLTWAVTLVVYDLAFASAVIRTRVSGCVFFICNAVTLQRKENSNIITKVVDKNI